ncbi:hypothetical protein GPECTOR_160g121 [Gonium pectorale]|uniref:Uncharacterized protein n=1 Tax=Gonium pectorale TaxID=33097 RepID=A0A150FXM5_GONPE|nr:hypothetical protein GPECTOR_160g121 [Gonium pectorale]|eukprot:KXZ42338.1 hypothetical protein GPECTOR_160g121 [Gonium pectorale]
MGIRQHARAASTGEAPPGAGEYIGGGGGLAEDEDEEPFGGHTDRDMESGEGSPTYVTDSETEDDYGVLHADTDETATVAALFPDPLPQMPAGTSSARAGAKAAAAACVCGRHHPRLRSGSPEWLKEHKLDLIYEAYTRDGERVQCPTVIQTAFTMLQLQEEFNIGKTQLDALLCLVFKRLVPQPCLLPSTLHLLKKLIGARHWSEFQVHVCDTKHCPGHVFDPLKKSEWEAHKDDCCPHCATPRFNVTVIGEHQHIEPRSWYIDFGLEETIQLLALSDDFTVKRASGRAPDEHGGHYMQGDAFKKLCVYLRNAPMEEWSSIYALLFDFLEPYKSVTYSIGVMEKMRVGDARLKLSNQDYIDRGQRVHNEYQKSAAAGLRQQRVDGATGLLPIVDLVRRPSADGSAMLGYIDVPNLYVVPAAHALLNGVLDNFLDVILVRELPVPPEQTPFVVDAAGRKVIQKRAKDIFVSSDFGRRYRDIMTYRGSWTMEDKLHFVETIAPYIFKDVLTEELSLMWAHLTHAILHYFRPGRFDTRKDFLTAARDAHESLLMFARLAEQYDLPEKTFSLNLHIAVCRLYEQEVARGSAAADNEFVVERMMQDFKRVAGRRVAVKIEEHFAEQHLVTRAMAWVRRDHPELLDLYAMLGQSQRDLTIPKFDWGERRGSWFPRAALEAVLSSRNVEAWRQQRPQDTVEEDAARSLEAHSGAAEQAVEALWRAAEAAKVHAGAAALAVPNALEACHKLIAAANKAAKQAASASRACQGRGLSAGTIFEIVDPVRTAADEARVAALAAARSAMDVVATLSKAVQGLANGLLSLSEIQRSVQQLQEVVMAAAVEPQPPVVSCNAGENGHIPAALIHDKAEINGTELFSARYKRATRRRSYYFLINYDKENTRTGAVESTPYFVKVKYFIRLPSVRDVPVLGDDGMERDGPVLPRVRAAVVEFAEATEVLPPGDAEAAQNPEHIGGRLFYVTDSALKPYMIPASAFAEAAWCKVIVALPRKMRPDCDEPPGRTYFMPYNHSTFR